MGTCVHAQNVHSITDLSVQLWVHYQSWGDRDTDWQKLNIVCKGGECCGGSCRLAAGAAFN